MLKRWLAFFKPIPQLSPQEALARLEQPQTVMLDVREAQERKHIFIPKTVHIPLANLAEEASRLAKEQHLIMQCQTGRRSQMAAKILQAQGFEVSNLRGGLQAWQAHGLAVKRGRG